MYMFKLCLGIHKLIIYKARGVVGLLDTTYCHPFLDPVTNVKKKFKKKEKRKSCKKKRQTEFFNRPQKCLSPLQFFALQALFI